MDRFFKLTERGTSVRTEVLGGLTTFVTMAYIMVVNPAILSFAGIPSGPGTVATILTAVFGCALMGLIANRPIAVAPYMGENAFIAFGLVALGIGWEQRLGAVFVSGVLFLLITLLGIRGWLANAVPAGLKHSFAAGIGLFLAFIGLYETGIVTSFVTGMPAEVLPKGAGGLLAAPAVPVKIGDLRDPQVLLAVLGFLLMIVLMLRKVRGALLIGIAVTAVIGGLAGFGSAPKAVMALPFTGDYDLGAIAFKLDILGVLKLSFLPVLLTLFLMSFLDTLGTLTGLGAAADLLDEKGNFPQVEKPMLVDALTCMFSGLIGTSTSGAYIESATGISEGARTGLAALVTAGLFAVSLFFIPLIEPLQQLRFAYGPALIAVGVLMMGSVRRIDFEDLTEWVPAFVTIVMMLFTYNIANGLTAGFVVHPVLKGAAGRWRELNAGMLILAGMCAAYYLLGMVH
ncbi:putative MFS transporter, AGZA family, xanthine/uracil permease [Prosthecobacter debontii]|uniref:Putative MFS transporter, AGZA family, xanthine/uracil permease n=1 Tax=Prosthecobacter debontii TaxID=48467 RepID=A0A1T4Y4Q0_9BACT|nr:NCS2 family permease [Prosthecobacter debontii]SKA96784.1 putative MFS transporter, AGZA family, xanthine/uracil permease [Prosthecobacter debontii]